jgi:hypothetical protein
MEEIWISKLASMDGLCFGVELPMMSIFSVQRIWRKAAPKDFIEHIRRQTHAKTAQNSGTQEP